MRILRIHNIFSTIMRGKKRRKTQILHYLLLACLLSLLILVNAAAASSKAQDTLEVNRRKTSGSANCLPSPEVNLLIPAKMKQNVNKTIKISNNEALGYSFSG